MLRARLYDWSSRRTYQRAEPRRDGRCHLVIDLRRLGEWHCGILDTRELPSSAASDVDESAASIPAVFFLSPTCRQTGDSWLARRQDWKRQLCRSQETSLVH